ncbi:MAG: response regulator transcription factor [Caldilineaceae bacterium]|nr:response regulator transcription factor [Caldilineaceae bacterium]
MKKATCRILVIDDDPEITRAVRLSITLQVPEWQVIEAHDGPSGLELIARESPDLILLDLSMPVMHGFDVLKELRLTSAVPVIFLTVQNDELSKVRGLELGADDYIVKPFGHLELLARIRSVLRRTTGQTQPMEHPYRSGEMTIDFARRRVTLAGEPVRLTNTEYRLLEVLAQNAGHIVENELLLQRVWGYERGDEVESLKVLIYRLRQKIEPDPAHPRYLLTERGVGYWLETGE